MALLCVLSHQCFARPAGCMHAPPIVDRGAQPALGAAQGAARRTDVAEQALALVVGGEAVVRPSGFGADVEPELAVPTALRNIAVAHSLGFPLVRTYILRFLVASLADCRGTFFSLFHCMRQRCRVLQLRSRRRREAPTSAITKSPLERKVMDNPQGRSWTRTRSRTYANQFLFFRIVRSRPSRCSRTATEGEVGFTPFDLVIAPHTIVNANPAQR